MRIALVVTIFPALSETFILNQIVGLIERGHEVDIYALRRGNQAQSHPEVQRFGLLERTVYAEPMPRTRLQRIRRAIRLTSGHARHDVVGALNGWNVMRYGRAALSLRFPFAAAPLLGTCRRYDVIHAHFGSSGLRALYLKEAGLIAGKLVTTFHGADMTVGLRRYGSAVYAPLLARGDLFLPVSDRWRRNLIAMGADPNRTVVHRMGIDCAPGTGKRIVATEHAVNFLSVCRLTEKKGIEYALRALARVATPKFHYDIVGEGPLRPALEDLARELGVADRVTFHGARDKTAVRAFLERADIFLQPSVTALDGDQEGIPVAIMEAMSLELPVISTYHSGIPELVRDGQAGSLVPERDVPALAAAVEKLLRDRATCRRMGQAGRRIVVEQYNVDRQNERLIELYEALLPADNAAVGERYRRFGGV